MAAEKSNLTKISITNNLSVKGAKKTAKDFDVNLPPCLIDLFDRDLNLITIPEIFMEYYLMVGPIFAQTKCKVPAEVFRASSSGGNHLSSFR